MPRFIWVAQYLDLESPNETWPIALNADQIISVEEAEDRRATPIVMSNGTTYYVSNSATEIVEQLEG